MSNAARITVPGGSDGGKVAVYNSGSDAWDLRLLPVRNIVDSGAVGDGLERHDGAITSGAAVLTSASGGFVAGDVGHYIAVTGAGTAGAVLVTTILTFTSSTQVTLAANAGTTVSSAAFMYGTDNTTAIQGVLDTLGALGPSSPNLQYTNAANTYVGGGTAWIPRGVFIVGQLAVPNRVGIDGTGWGSMLKAKANIGGPVVTNKPHANMCQVSRVRVDGSKSLQATGSNRHGVLWSNSLTYADTTDEEFDGLFKCAAVLAWRCKDSGFVTVGRGMTYFTGCKAYFCDGNGYKFDQDTNANGCESGWSGLEGFLAVGSGGSFVGCKSWYCGQVTGASGHGFHLLSLNNFQVSGCQGQDNLASGLFVDGCTSGGIAVSGFTADSNSVSSNGTYGGIDLSNSANCRIDGVSVDNSRAANRQGYALRALSSSSGNIITLGSTGNVTGHISQDATSLGNSIAVNGSAGGVQTPAFAATITPDPYAGEIVKPGALTANLTIGAPTSGHMGQSLAFVFTQDATGTRTVTFNAAFKKAGGAFTASTGNAARSSISFVYDGSVWVESTRALALA